MRSVLLVVALRALGADGHPCDAEAAAACPFDGGAALGVCLTTPSKHEVETTLSAECEAFVGMHAACAAEFQGGTCGGSAYTEDALLCLTSWMSPADVSAACSAVLPAKKEEVVQELDEATLKKRAARKRAREKAAEEVRQLNEKNSGAAPKSSKTTAAKRTKKKKKKPTGNMYEDL